MHELYFFHFLYFSGTLNNNELKRIARRDLGNLDFSLFTLHFSLAKHSSLFTFNFSLAKHFHFSLRRRRLQQITQIIIIHT